MVWHQIGTAEERRQRPVVRVAGRQILVIFGKDGPRAVNNRCPHEGYPLSEGTLTADGCILTCQWHNWKFDLVSGETLIGGDRLTAYPVREEAGELWVAIEELPEAERRAQSLYALEQGLTDNDYSRLSREVARLSALPGDAAGLALGRAIRWAAPLLEDGMGHGFAGAADWLDRSASAEHPAERLASLTEALGHIADECRGHARYPHAEGREPWDEEVFLAVAEAQDEARADRLLRDALAEGVPLPQLKRVLARVALAHYIGFGHAVIYVVAAFRLLPRLEEPARLVLLHSLARSLLRQRREDLIPQFRGYAPALADWGTGRAAAPLSAEGLHRLPLAAVFRRLLDWSGVHAPQEIFAVLVTAAARSMAAFDSRHDGEIEVSPADSVGWLDFTHVLTFADAGAALAAEDAGLWPSVLMQLGCFLGRNQPYLRASDGEEDGRALNDWWPEVLNHQEGRYINSVHRLKTLAAAARLAEQLPLAAPALRAAMAAYLSARVKPRHPLRLAHQALALVG